MKRRLLPAALLLASPAFAFAQDQRALSGRAGGQDDIDFANALVASGYPDLAEKLLAVVEKKGGNPGEAQATIELIKLNIAQETASKLEDLIARKDALIKVLRAKEKFIQTAQGKGAAEDCRNALPELYNLIGESITAAIKKEKNEKVLDKLREEGDAIFVQAEHAAKARIAELKGLNEPTPEDEFKLMAAEYNYARMLYFHSLLFSPGSGRRMELCNLALAEYDEFDLSYQDEMLCIYAWIDTANCLKEIGKTDDAISSLNKAIGLRESWGEKNSKGVWPIDGRDVVDIVAYAMLQKMLLLEESKQLDKIEEVGKDYFASTPEPWDTPFCINIARKLAEAHLAKGDRAGHDALAKKMIEIDPNGYGGRVGRELMASVGGGSFSDLLTSAQQKIAANEYEQGVALCRQAMADTAGTPDEQKAGCQSLLLIGYSYQKRGWSEEAALAYQTAVDRFPKADGAPEALSLAIDCYIASNGGRRKVLKDLAEAGMTQLIREYPKSPYAPTIQMKRAAALERDGDFLGAIELYKAVRAESTDYTKALLMIGIDYFQHALKLEAAKDKKPDDAKPFYAQAETGFKAAIDAIRKRRPTSIDPEVQKGLDGQEYLATLSLAKLYMVDAFKRIADASGVIDTLEATWGKIPEKAAEIQNLRGRWFLAQGKFEEAEKWVNELYARDKKASAGPAGQLARALDEQGQEKLKAKPDSLEGEDLWKRAARFYYISIKPQVDGTESQDSVEMTGVGNRLYVYGLHFNGVPADRESFVDWVPGTKRAPDYWVKAAEIYEAALAQTPDYRMTINLARTYGFLGKWLDATRIHQKLFENEPILNPKDKRKLDPSLVKTKGELVFAYLEFGVAERMAFAADGDKSRLQRARDVIITPLCNTLKPDTSGQAYWGARYHLVRVLMDRGEYPDAKLNVEDVQRNVSPTFDDGKFGYKALFEATIEELKKKF